MYARLFLRDEQFQWRPFVCVLPASLRFDVVSQWLYCITASSIGVPWKLGLAAPGLRARREELVEQRRAMCVRANVGQQPSFRFGVVFVRVLFRRGGGWWVLLVALSPCNRELGEAR